MCDLNTTNLEELACLKPGARAGSPEGCGVVTVHPFLQSFPPCLSAGLQPVVFTVGDVRPQPEE